MNEKITISEGILVEGTTALIKRPGYANEARFISLLGKVIWWWI